ncbi:hypothetical protein [Streptomyces sp. NPDC046182]|uniref:hypothetical protein n=1 Tax=Streptomyces sp. NPDC046182 TaxID=3154601 RepID=UPI0033C2C41F
MTDYIDMVTVRDAAAVAEPLAEWDGRVTSALIRVAERDELVWLLWDFSPQFEIWLHAELGGEQGKALRESGAQDIATVLAGSPTSATLVLFDPAADAATAELLQIHWKTKHDAQTLARAGARDVAYEAQARAREHGADHLGGKLSEVVASLEGLRLATA